MTHCPERAEQPSPGWSGAEPGGVLLYHIVFSTKNRKPIIQPAVKPQLFAYLAGCIRSMGGSASIVNGTADHVHMLVRLKQDRALADLMRDLKANSSKWLHRDFPSCQGFSLQGGYGAFTVSESQAKRVRAYIETQERHHQRVSFKEEYVAMLKAHGIDYDPQNLWT